MHEPTDEEVRQYLAQHGQLAGPAAYDTNAWWRISDAGPYHREEDALAIIRACLMLGVPVTDTITSEMWLALVERVAQIERHFERMLDE